jgi:hypothetical protein
MIGRALDLGVSILIPPRSEARDQKMVRFLGITGHHRLTRRDCRPAADLSRDFAQSSQLSRSLYIEPGVTMLRAPDGSRQVLGKVMIDLSTGNVWGLPTTVEQPYPCLSLPSFRMVRIAAY